MRSRLADLCRVAQAVALRLNVVGVWLYDTGSEGAMVERAVVALGVVLDRHLPVAGLWCIDPFQRLQVIDVRHEGLELFTHAGKPLVHGGSVCIEVCEHETVKYFDAYRCEADLFAIETGHRIDVRPGAQLAVQGIGPGVVRTDHFAGVAFATQQFMSPVLADVVETVQLTLPVAYAEKIFAGNGKGEIVTGFGDERAVAGKLPGAGQQSCLFQAEDLRISVVASLQRADRLGS